MDDGSQTTWLIVLLLLVAAMVFAVAETAFASVSRIRLRTEAEKGEKARMHSCPCESVMETEPVDEVIRSNSSFDEEGYLHLAGRIKDVIIRGGENISPAEIEGALNRMENIREAKVMGAPHSIYGESVEACVTMTDGGRSFDQEALKTALRSVIARYKVPSHIFP